VGKVSRLNETFQQHYQSAERAYAESDFTTAEALASGLLTQLNDNNWDEADQPSAKQWRSVVALLLGNVHWYGLHQAETAAEFYRVVLENDPDATLQELARQGLDECQNEATDASPKQNLSSTSPSSTTARATDLLRDPFMTEQPMTAGATPVQSTAMPWLESQTTAAKPVDPPEEEADVTTLAEPNPETEPEPEPEPKPVAIDPKVMSMDLLQKNWIRISVASDMDDDTIENDDPNNNPKA